MKRTERITLRLTKAELKVIEKNADKMGLGKSTYLRVQGLKEVSK